MVLLIGGPNLSGRGARYAGKNSETGKLFLFLNALKKFAGYQWKFNQRSMKLPCLTNTKYKIWYVLIERTSFLSLLSTAEFLLAVVLPLKMLEEDELEGEAWATERCCDQTDRKWLHLKKKSCIYVTETTAVTAGAESSVRQTFVQQETWHPPAWSCPRFTWTLWLNISQHST